MRSNPLSERKTPRFFPVYAGIDRPFSRALNICTDCPTIKTAPIPVKAKFIIFPQSMSIAQKTRRFFCHAATADLTALAQGRTIDARKLRFAERSLFDSQQIARIYRDGGLFFGAVKIENDTAGATLVAIIGITNDNSAHRGRSCRSSARRSGKNATNPT